MSTVAPVVVDAEELASVVRDCFTGIGLAQEDATAVSDVLVDANLRGIESHGLQRVPTYMDRVFAGLAHGTEHVQVVVQHGPVCRLDAGAALGPAIGVKAIDRAISLARQHGIGLVAVGSSTHFGTAGYYAARAARATTVAVVMTNAPKTMAPFQAREPFLGTNPLAIAAPIGRHGEFVLDMSSSAVARGRIIRAAQADEPIEPGLALGPTGAPTTDPHEALAGSVLPLGGAKGSGLALAIALLAGTLGGADFDHEMASMYEDFDRPQNVGHIFIVVDPSLLVDADEAVVRAERLIDALHAVPTVNGEDRVRFAGELEAMRSAQRRRAGIPVSRTEIVAVIEKCRELGLGEVAAHADAWLANQ